MTVLALQVERNDPVCIACAEKCANDSGYPVLFWMANRPVLIADETVCWSCGNAMGSEQSEQASARVAKIPNEA